MNAYKNSLTQWVVVCACMLFAGVFFGYNVKNPNPVTDVGKLITPAPVEAPSLPVNFVLRPLAPYVHQYLIDNYAAYDQNSIVVIATWDDWCMGVTCEYWVVKPQFTQLALMLRCYHTFGDICVPTFENDLVLPAEGSPPTPTNYSPTPVLLPGSGDSGNDS